MIYYRYNLDILFFILVLKILLQILLLEDIEAHDDDMWIFPKTCIIIYIMNNHF